MNIVNINNLIDIRKIQKIQDELALAMELAVILVDYKGNPITRHSNCSRFCNMARENEKYNLLCEKCDSRGGLEAARQQRAYIYKCHFGLIDFAIPIIINNQYMGALMAGQVNVIDDQDELEWIVSKKHQTNIKDCPELESAFNEITSIDAKRLTAAAHMIEYGIRYIVEEAVGKKELYNEVLDMQAYYQKEFYESKAVLQPAFDYVKQNYKRKISMEDMAKLCNISTGYFSKLFKKRSGKSFTTYINDMKLEKASRLLENEDIPIINISLELGYDDCSYFIRLFKKKYGKTPSIYQKNINI